MENLCTVVGLTAETLKAARGRMEEELVAAAAAVVVVVVVVVVVLEGNPRG